MNKIRGLAIQSGLIAPYGSEHEGLVDFDWRKFAELIIAECVEVCNRQAEHYAETNNPAPATSTAYALGKMIQMHFEE